MLKQYTYFISILSSEPEIESFDKILYKGDLENGIVSHDVIILSNYDDSNVLLSGGKKTI